MQHLPRDQPPQDVVDHIPVDVKVDDVVALVFVAVVAQRSSSAWLTRMMVPSGPTQCIGTAAFSKKSASSCSPPTELLTGLLEIVDIYRGSHPMLQLSVRTLRGTTRASIQRYSPSCRR